ncbi:MAG TPA: hypothetical protein VGI86_04520, partial [Acidimicrobiia bacterium]
MSCATVETTVLGVILSGVPVHLMIDVRVDEPVLVDRLEHSAGFSPVLTEVDVIDAVRPAVSEFAPCLMTPVQVAVLFDDVVTGVPAPPPATQVASSVIDAMAALTVALASGSALAPECWLCSHGSVRLGLSLTEPVTVQLTLLPAPAVMIGALALADGTAMKPAAPSASTAPVAPSHLEIFTWCVSSVGAESAGPRAD